MEKSQVDKREKSRYRLGLRKNSKNDYTFTVAIKASQKTNRGLYGNLEIVEVLKEDKMTLSFDNGDVLPIEVSVTPLGSWGIGIGQKTIEIGFNMSSTNVKNLIQKYVSHNIVGIEWRNIYYRINIPTAATFKAMYEQIKDK